MCLTLLFGNKYMNLDKKLCTCVNNNYNTVIMQYDTKLVKYPKLLFAGVYVAMFGRRTFCIC